MITISEIATPMTLLQSHGSLLQLQEARVTGFFIPKNNSDLLYWHDQCECQSIVKGDIFKLVLNILTHCLVAKSLVWLQTVQIEVYSKFPNSQIFYPEHKKQVNS